MSRLDDELREALRREDPGPDFTSRVLARAAQRPEAKRAWWHALVAAFRPARIRWTTAGALACVLLVAGSVEYRRQQRIRAEGEAAKQQLVLALQIAGSKLRLAQERVIELNAYSDRE